MNAPRDLPEAALANAWPRNESSFANARLVLADEVVTGSLLVRDGRIASIDSGSSVPPGAEDLQGDYLLPGWWKSTPTTSSVT